MYASKAGMMGKLWQHTGIGMGYVHAWLLLSTNIQVSLQANYIYIVHVFRTLLQWFVHVH